MIKLKNLKKRMMEDPEFREEYARVDEEFALIEALGRGGFAVLFSDVTRRSRGGLHAVAGLRAETCRS